MAKRKATAAKKKKASAPAARPAVRKASPVSGERRRRGERGGKGHPLSVRLEPAQLALLRGLGRVRAGGNSAFIEEGLASVLPRALRTLRAADPESAAFAATVARRELERMLEELAGTSSLDEAGAEEARQALEAMLAE